MLLHLRLWRDLRVLFKVLGINSKYKLRYFIHLDYFWIQFMIFKRQIAFRKMYHIKKAMPCRKGKESNNHSRKPGCPYNTFFPCDVCLKEFPVITIPFSSPLNNDISIRKLLEIETGINIFIDHRIRAPCSWHCIMQSAIYWYDNPARGKLFKVIGISDNLLGCEIVGKLWSDAFIGFYFADSIGAAASDCLLIPSK